MTVLVCGGRDFADRATHNLNQRGTSPAHVANETGPAPPRRNAMRTLVLDPDTIKRFLDARKAGIEVREVGP